MSDSSVLVVIPVFGREDVFTTVGFLRTRPYAGSLRFIIIDNGNGPALSERLAGLAGPDCEVIRLERNRGGSGAFRAGMQAALKRPDDTFVWLLDDDALVNDRTLPALLEEWKRLSGEGRRPGAVGSAMMGRVEPDRMIELGSAISRITSKQRPRFRGRTLAEVGERTAPVEYVAAASLLTTVGVIREVGIFEDVFIHFDDIEWNFRLHQRGYSVYATSKSHVNHIEKVAKISNWIEYYNVRNRLWFLRRHLPLLHKVIVLERLVRVVLYSCLGRRELARMMGLGLRHSFSGRLLMRDELKDVRSCSK